MCRSTTARTHQPGWKAVLLPDDRYDVYIWVSDRLARANGWWHFDVFDNKAEVEDWHQRFGSGTILWEP